MSSYKVPRRSARRQSINNFKTERQRGSIVTISTTTLFAIHKVLLLSITALFLTSLIFLGPSLFVERIAWTETSKSNATQAWWMDLNFDNDGSTTTSSTQQPKAETEPEPEPETEPETVPEPERRQLPETEPEDKEPEPEDSLGRDSNRPEPEPEGEPDFDGNVYLRGPLEGIPTIGTKFALFSFDYSNLTVALVLRCLYPTVVAIILGITGLALEQNGFDRSSNRERFDNMAFRISRRRLLLFGARKMQMQMRLIDKQPENDKHLLDAAPPQLEQERNWISTLFEEEANRYRRIVMKRRFKLRGVFCLHDRTSTLFFYFLLVTLVLCVGGFSYMVRSADYVRKNIVLYCLLLPLTEIMLVPTIKQLTSHCHVKQISKKWYFQSTSMLNPDYNTFTTKLTKFRSLAVNCCLFPMIICWNPLSAWTLVHPMDPDNKTNLMKVYMQRSIFTSSEIVIYIWSSSLTTQSIGLAKALFDYNKKTVDPTTIGVVGPHTEVPVYLGNSCYVVFLACYISILTSNPFTYAIAAIAIVATHGMFLLRARMKMSKYNIRFDEVRVPKTTMFTQHAWAVFAWIFVPCSQVFSCIFLLPFNPVGNAIAFFVNVLASCVLLTVLRHRWPSAMKR